MSRILRHVGHKDFQKTRQRQINEEKERAAKKLKELQEAEKERKKIEEAARPYKSNWREELLREFGEWTPVNGAGPTNSTAQTFGFSVGGFQQSNFETGQPVTYTASGLGGVEASNTGGQTIVDFGFGEVAFVDAPTYDQLALAGYAKPLGFGVQRRRDYEDVNPKLDASQEFAQNVGADYMMNARPMTTDMDKFMEMYRNRWQDTEGPGAPGTGAEGQWWLSMMELINSGMSYDDALKQLGPMPPRENPAAARREAEKREADAEKREAEAPPFDYGMWDLAQQILNRSKGSSTDSTNMGLSQQDLQWLNNKQNLVNMLKTMQNYGGPAVDFAQWAINWAKGNYTPITKFSPKMQNDVLDQISKTLANRPGTSGAVQYHDYGTFTNNSTRLGLGRFHFEITPDGVKVNDNFDVDRGGSAVGGILNLIPGLQSDADKITELGNKVGGGKGKIPINVTIPWSQVPPQLQNKLDPNQLMVPIVRKNKRGRVVNKRGRVVESTWNKVQKHMKKD